MRIRTNIDLQEYLAVAVPKQVALLKANGGPVKADYMHATQVWADMAFDILMMKQDKEFAQLLAELTFSIAVFSFDKNGIKYMNKTWVAQV